MLFLPEFVKGVRHLFLLRWEEMGVAISDIDALVANPLGNRKRREPHVDEQGYVAVPKVVDADALNAASFVPSLHLVAEEVLRHLEDPVMRLQVISQLQILSHLLVQEPRNRDRPDGLRRLRVGDGVYTPEALV